MVRHQCAPSGSPIRKNTPDTEMVANHLTTWSVTNCLGLNIGRWLVSTCKAPAEGARCRQPCVTVRQQSVLKELPSQRIHTLLGGTYRLRSETAAAKLKKADLVGYLCRDEANVKNSKSHPALQKPKRGWRCRRA